MYFKQAAVVTVWVNMPLISEIDFFVSVSELNDKSLIPMTLPHELTDTFAPLAIVLSTPMSLLVKLVILFNDEARLIFFFAYLFNCK